jgi:hypothetical protein
MEGLLARDAGRAMFYGKRFFDGIDGMRRKNGQNLRVH